MNSPCLELEEALRFGTTGPEPSTALIEGVRERAESEGLLDVAYCEIDSPVGPLIAASTSRGLVKLSFPNHPSDEMLERLAEAIGPRIIESRARLDPVRRELDEYFAGRRRDFDLELDWRLTSGFVRRVLRETELIPFGQTRSYREMANAAGSPRAFRAAGSALGANPIPIVVPCHRVLRSGGALGGYGGGLETKRRLLELEGVIEPG
jgi:methylated-DNA-[protein]-cysteine S-methyltransferase